jgi:hypothetical protein
VTQATWEGIAAVKRRHRVAAALAATMLTGCVSHPVGPARTYGKYEGKAVATAQSARSAVQTARLAVDAATKHHVFGPYVSQAIGQAEDAVSAVQGTFASIQPPNGDADGLRRQLLDLLSDAEDHVAAVRIAVRRGHIGDLGEIASPLAGDAAALLRFAEDHG